AILVQVADDRLAGRAQLRRPRLVEALDAQLPAQMVGERGGRAQEIVEGGPLGIVALRTLVARIEVVLEEIAVINLLKAVFPRLRARLGRRRVAAAFISQVRV